MFKIPRWYTEFDHPWATLRRAAMYEALSHAYPELEHAWPQVSLPGLREVYRERDERSDAEHAEAERAEAAQAEFPDGPAGPHDLDETSALSESGELNESGEPGEIRELREFETWARPEQSQESVQSRVGGQAEHAEHAARETAQRAADGRQAAQRGSEGRRAALQRPQVVQRHAKVDLARVLPRQAAVPMSQATAAGWLKRAGLRLSSSGGCTSKHGHHCTSLEKVRTGTIASVIALKQRSGCPIMVTGGTEAGHAPGRYSHGNGYKLDITPNACISRYITKNHKYTGVRSDGARLYRSASGTVFANEGDHWDILFK
ncbi:hypothetical protein [Nonomuraea antri]|uniref:hypothetical protein n=1 Tax=Nonomuraea antri TaxID=2730852 RepID=UPI001C2BD4F0|nr:hypothetical protein [Nonomuraea antri]